MCSLLVWAVGTTRGAEWTVPAPARWEKRARLWKDAQTWLGSIYPIPDSASMWTGGDGARWMREMLGFRLADEVPHDLSSPPAANDSDPNAVESGKPLPICARTMLYNLAGAHGFASEFGVYLRLAAIADHFKYALLIDDSAWNYGRLSDYFEPPRLSCRPPKDWLSMPRTKVGRRYRSQSLEEALGEPTRHWVAEHHVFAMRDLEYFDALFLRAFVNEKALDVLHQRELDGAGPFPPLAGDLVLPKLFHKSFRAQAHSLSRIYRPNAGMRHEIAAMESSLGLPSDGRDTLTATGQITIAMHVRSVEPSASAFAGVLMSFSLDNSLGDKVRELDRFGPQAFAPKDWHPPSDPQTSTVLARRQLSPRADDEVSWNRDRMALYLAAARSLRDDIRKETGKGVDRTSRLLVMTDDPAAVQGLLGEADPAEWEVVVTSQKKVVASKMARLRRRWRKSKATHTTEAGFHEGVFNALPAEERVKEARHFLRDLTVLGRRADGLVFTGSSNVSRIFALLAGADRTLQTGARRLRSLDVRWHPTSRYV